MRAEGGDGKEDEQREDGGSSRAGQQGHWRNQCPSAAQLLALRCGLWPAAAQSSRSNSKHDMHECKEGRWVGACVRVCVCAGACVCLLACLPACMPACVRVCAPPVTSHSSKAADRSHSMRLSRRTVARAHQPRRCAAVNSSHTVACRDRGARAPALRRLKSSCRDRGARAPALRRLKSSCRDRGRQAGRQLGRRRTRPSRRRTRGGTPSSLCAYSHPVAFFLNTASALQETSVLGRKQHHDVHLAPRAY